MTTTSISKSRGGYYMFMLVTERELQDWWKNRKKIKGTGGKTNKEKQDFKRKSKSLGEKKDPNMTGKAKKKQREDKSEGKQ